jgi:hypothetical protein
MTINAEIKKYDPELKIDNLAELKQMTPEEFRSWSEAEAQRQQISADEVNLIMAYQISQAIKILRDRGKFRLADEVEKDSWWYKRFKDDFIKIGPAIKHLTDVCSHVKDKYGEYYHWEWLLNFDEDLAHKVQKDSGKGKKISYF